MVTDTINLAGSLARRICALLAAGVLLATSAHGQAATRAANGWRILAEEDVDALYASIRALHPGYRDPETPDFAGRVEAAYRVARKQAKAARSYLDWRAATLGFMLSFRDGHTMYRLNATPARVRWPGFLIDHQGSGYVLRTPVGPGSVETDIPQGARVLSCDGVAIETLLQTRLDGSEADWSKPPERIRQAYRLFIDYRNEGPVPITACRVVGPQGESDIRLSWRPETWSSLLPALAPFNREVDRPIGVRVLPDGARWIALGDFGDEAKLSELAARVEADITEIRSAPYLVLDLRGNRGGNSGWGPTFANLIWGEDAVSNAVARREASLPPRGGKFWRASPEAAREARRVAAGFADQGPSMAGPAQYFDEVATLIDKAPQGDRALVEDPCCRPDPAVMPQEQVAPAYARPVFLLTDAACFSSCVLALGPLRAMGAQVVGETTGQNEEYGEIAGPLTTPSGLGRYSVPMTIIRQRPETLVVAPDRVWPGAMDDDAGIEAWIREMSQSFPAGACQANVDSGSAPRHAQSC